MPTKLKILLALLALSLATNLLTGKWFAALIGAALMAGVVKGSEGTRTIVIVLGYLGLVASAFTLIVSLAAGGALIGIIGFGAALLGAGQSAFTIWCMSQADVQDWMFKRSLPDSVRDL